MTNEEAKLFLDNLKICIDEHPIVADWLVEIADRKTEPTSSKMEQVDEPTTQTETQNSNLTFKTLEYCDICDHKGCEECIANALDEHCMPSQFNKQIEDECAKEYEELGLKELKELIEADRKTESSSEIPNNSTISKMEQVDKPTEITYQNCADALLKMWMDNVLTDAEYNRIMDKLNNAQRKDEPSNSEIPNNSND